MGTYVEVIRNTPLIIQSYFFIFGLSSIGLKLSVLTGAVLALVINITAYTCEIIRAGIESVPRSQREAGECLGLSPLQVYWHIILAPALERVYPALTSQFILLMLVTSLLSAVGAEELFGVSNIIQSMTFRNFEVFIGALGDLSSDFLDGARRVPVGRKRSCSCASASWYSPFGYTHMSQEQIAYLLEGAWGTILLSLLTFLFSAMLGSLVALMRVSDNIAIRGFAGGYINAIQGTPLLVTMGICFYGPSIFGLGSMSALFAAVLALTVQRPFWEKSGAGASRRCPGINGKPADAWG